MLNNTPHCRVSTLARACSSISIILAGCGIHNTTAPNASSCKFAGSNAGLKISAEPFTEKDKLRRFFGVDLLSKGVLPVLIVFENKNAEDGFSIVQEHAQLAIGKSNPDFEKDAHTSPNVHATEPPLTYSTSIQALLPIQALPVALLIGGVDQLVEGYHCAPAVVAQNLEEKKLTHKIVYPGSTHYGFLYFRIEGRDNAQNITRMVFDAKNIRTNEMTTITTVIR